MLFHILNVLAMNMQNSGMHVCMCMAAHHKQLHNLALLYLKSRLHVDLATLPVLTGKLGILEYSNTSAFSI